MEEWLVVRELPTAIGLMKPETKQMIHAALFFTVEYGSQCTTHDHLLCFGRHIAGFEESSILTDHAFNSIEAAVGSEYQFRKRTLVVCWRLRFPFPLAGPPEESPKFLQPTAHLGQCGTAKVEEDIRVPPRNFCGPLIFGIAAVSSDHRQFRKTRLGTAYCQCFPFSLIVVALSAMQNSSHLIATVDLHQRYNGESEVSLLSNLSIPKTRKQQEA
jgi:hypothetical protein